VGLAVTFVTAACAAKTVRTAPASDVPRVKTVAVLPFQNNSITQSFHTQGLARTLTDRITERLATSVAVTLIDRESIEKVLNELSLSSQGMTQSEGRLTLGNLLGAHYLIMGEYSEIVGNLRLDARIVEVQGGTVIGSDSIEGQVAQRKKMETGFAKTVSALLLDKVGSPVGMHAFNSADYLRMGMQFEKQQEFEKALAKYKKALSLDPDNAQANERLQAVLLMAIE